jgi:uncharacterized protein (DUF305 family)
MRRTRIGLVMAALLVPMASACATAASEPPRQPERRPGMAAAEIEALYEARADSARQHFTAADTRFMTSMIGHHAQALVMARLAPTHGASPAVRTLAARIINAQEDEIALMQRWLLNRGQPVPEIHIDGLQLMIHGPEHAMHMPGMLTDEQMRELDAAHGPEFDRLFLTYMIQHHRGAVAMVHELFETDGAGQDEDAFRLASDVQVDQITEISRMEIMLEQMSRRDGPQ